MTAGLLLVVATGPAGAEEGGKKVPAVLSFKMKGLDGKDVDLGQYQGKVVLIVNVASKCGYTPQYKGLQELFDRMKGKDFVVVGFPSNDFGGQEPGKPEEIKKFCELRYKVTFPMMEKVITHGEGQSSVYAFLTAKHGEPKWNFHKYLIGKDGRVKAAFKSAVEPGSAELKAAIDAALAD
jgi:glutathione peroxidase